MNGILCKDRLGYTVLSFSLFIDYFIFLLTKIDNMPCHDIWKTETPYKMLNENLHKYMYNRRF